MNMDFIKKISVKHKLVILPTLLLIFIVGIMYFAILPLMFDIKETKSEIKDKKKKVEAKHQQRKQIGENAKKVERIKSQSEILNKPFVLNSQNLEFITKLEEVAANSGVRQELDIVTKKKESEDLYTIIPLRIKTKGDVQSQVDYLAQLESLDEVINIDYLQMNSASIASPGTEQRKDEGGDEDRDEDEDRDTSVRQRKQKIEMSIQAKTYWADEMEADNSNND